MNTPDSLIRGFEYKWYLVDAKTREVLAESEPTRNLVPQVGVDFVKEAIFGETAGIGSWYLGLFQNNYVPTSPVTAADLPSTVGEFTGYSQASRPLWVRTYDGVSVIDNVDDRAVFTPTVDQRIYGGFVVSTSTKGGNTGIVFSIARFNSPADLVVGQDFLLAAGLSLIPTV